MASRRVSLRAVETFVTVARSLSFTDAAESLGLTVSAVSRRVSDLEQELGVDLFRRLNRRIELTAAGVGYLAGVGEAVDRIHRESETLRADRTLKNIRLSTLPVFASWWLLPRLIDFRRERPDIEVEIETGSTLVDFAASDLHVGIRFGDGKWPGVVADRMMGVSLRPVGAPSLVARAGQITAALLDRYVYLKLDVPFDFWGEWFRSIGLPDYQPKRVKVYDSAQIIFEAAAAGMGLSIGAEALTAAYARSGRLVPIFSGDPVVSHSAYYMVYRERDRNWAPLRALRRVLLQAAAADEAAISAHAV